MGEKKKETYYEKKQTIIRMDHYLYEEIEKIAEEEERNVNSQIVYILKEYIKNKATTNDKM